MMSVIMYICGFEIAEKIYESANTLIYRTRSQEEKPKVVLKILKVEHPSQEVLVSFHHEFKIAQLLHSSNLIKIISIEKYKNRLVLLIEDFDGDSLHLWMKRSPLSIIDNLQLCISISQGLADIHAQSIIHKNINPSNIVWNRKTNEVKIIDYGIASQLERSFSLPMPPLSLEGSLYYMSPEQTGRMNRPLDYRSDLYSLGVTFYELFTGQRPFESDDPLAMIHSHIAREPISPDKINLMIPAVISQIILKLLSKSADDRYQSAEGVNFDLMECLRQFETQNCIEFFPLAKADVTSRFLLPANLYGCTDEVEKLMGLFARVCEGMTIFTLVKGYSGVGKTTLVQELYRPLALARGRYITGKYDQYQSNIPYSAFSAALNSLCLQLMGESIQILDEWRQLVVDAVGIYGQVLIEVIPSLEKVLGPQPPVAPLDSQAAQIRFEQVFQKFIALQCNPENPLVIFLDDLQWADAASLRLMTIIMNNPEIRSLHLIGAYRDNEVYAGHQLSLILHELEASGHILSKIHIKNMTYNCVSSLVSDTLFLPKKDVEDLAQVIYGKTEGNAFFTVEFLKALYTDGLLNFNRTSRCWIWNLKYIQARQISSNVIDLMSKRLESLPDNCKRILMFAACVGTYFDLKSLAIILEADNNVLLILEDLMPALHLGIILDQSNSSRYLGLVNIDAENIVFKFQHDQVQQAAYSLISLAERPKNHLKIARLLVSSYSGHEEIDKNIFDLVNHFNKASSIISDDMERISIARLNLKAGLKTKNASAYLAYFTYLSIAKENLHKNAFDTDYQLAFSVYLNFAVSCSITGKFDLAEQLYPIMLDRAKTLLDTIQVYSIQMEDYNLQGKYEKALSAQSHALVKLGFTLPTDEASWVLAIENEQALIPMNLKRRTVDELYFASEIESVEIKETLKILMSMFMSAFVSAQNSIVQWSAIKMTNLCLQHGNCEIAAFAYIQYGFICICRYQNFYLGYEFGQVALRLSDHYNNLKIRGRVYFSFGVIINPWSKHVSFSIDSLRKAYQFSIAACDWEYAAYIAGQIMAKLYIVGSPCDLAESEANEYLKFFKGKVDAVLNSLFIPGPFCALLNLLGKTISRESYTCEYFDEEAHLREVRSGTLTEAWFYFMKIRSLYLLRCFTQGIKFVDKVEIIEATLTGNLEIAETYFYSCLLIAELIKKGDLQKERFWILFDKYQKKIKLFAEHCPENFLHQHFLIQAERGRIENINLDKVIDFYNQAIAAASVNKYLNIKALAHELKGRCLLENSHHAAACIELKEALYGYRLWGASSKISMLEDEFPQLGNNLSDSVFGIDKGMISMQSAHIDMLSIYKSARAISGEIDQDKLSQIILAIVMENAGAERGLLLVLNNEACFIEAEGKIGQNEIEVITNLKIQVDLNFEHQSILPLSVVHFVIRTRSILILKNAVDDLQFGSDAYIKADKPRSLLCLPLILHGEIVGLIYLENYKITDAFTMRHKEILDLLGSQMAISLENSRLYRNLEIRQNSLQRSNDQLERSNRELEQFAYVASHDLQSPLKSLVNWVQMLEIHLPQPRSEELAQAIKFIEANSRKAISHIKGIMDMAKVGSSSVTVNSVDLNVIISGIKNILEQEILDARAKIYCPILPIVEGNNTFLEAVFKNILHNAILYRCQSRNLEIQIGFKEQLTYYEFFVKDNGIGIDSIFLTRIFQMYTRLNEEEEYPGGTGIGLAFTKKIIEKFGGKIWLQSVLGEGSTFFFTYPIKQG